MKLLIELLEILEPAIKAGIELNVGYDYESKYYVNINTGMKSECIIYVDEEYYIAKCRYDTVYKIHTFDDVLYAVSNCGHGRDYGCAKWMKLIEE